MLKKDVPLYWYRIFTVGGHVFRCLSEFSDIYELSKFLKDLEEKELEFETCYLGKQNEIIHLLINPSDIVAKEQVLYQGPISLQEFERELQPFRKKIMQKKEEQRKNIVGQVVRRK